MSLFEKQYTAEDIAAKPGDVIAPEGFYPVALRSVKTGSTQATQGRVDLLFSPLKEAGKLSSMNANIELNLMVLVDRWEDDEAFATSKRAKIAGKKGIDESDVPDSEVENAVARAKSMAQSTIYRTMRALLGEEEFAELPLFDAGAKAFFDSVGKSYTKEQKDEIYNSNVISACESLRKIATGEIDATGYVCYAKVEHNEFNGRKSVQVRNLFEDLPDGEETVPVAQWP